MNLHIFVAKTKTLSNKSYLLMPIIEKSDFDKNPYFIKHGHLETIIPSLFRDIKEVEYKRERIDTPDNDFLDLDWLKNQNNKLIILSHGLEGSSERRYIKSCAKYFHDKNWDVLAWNYRTCSGEMNRQLRMYHHGVTDDLETVIKHSTTDNNYKNVVLVGFSMGGSTTLKYLGEKGTEAIGEISAAAVFSVPCNLWDSAVQLTKIGNLFYKKRFLNKMKKKIVEKASLFPDKIDITGIDNIKHFDEFDRRYTAPLHGFKDAHDFYRSSSSDQFYPNIKIPSLIVNGLNDPLLGDKCYPISMATSNENLFLETPKFGGHVGFSIKGKEHSWMDERAFEFVSQYVV